MISSRSIGTTSAIHPKGARADNIHTPPANGNNTKSLHASYKASSSTYKASSSRFPLLARPVLLAHGEHLHRLTPGAGSQRPRLAPPRQNRPIVNENHATLWQAESVAGLPEHREKQVARRHLESFSEHRTRSLQPTEAQRHPFVWYTAFQRPSLDGVRPWP